MNKLFSEYENENSRRTFPFASGCQVRDTNGEAIGTGILLDAVIYPVNSTGIVYLSRIDTDGTVSISDDTGVIMQAKQEYGASELEFYDLSSLHRHVGTVVASSAEALSTLTTVYEQRRFRPEETAFASSCVFPVQNDGITGLNIGKSGLLDGNVIFSNDENDIVRVSTDESGSTLRFDVIPDAHIVKLTSIQHIFCVVDGKTPFRIHKIPFLGQDTMSSGNTVALTLDGIERQDVCNNANRENSLEMTDTCKECTTDECHQDPIPPKDIPATYQTEAVDIKSGMDSSFYLAVPNLLGYVNPLSITLDDGMIVPKFDFKLSEADAEADNTSKVADTVTSKGIVIQVPGLENS